jgi:cleavage and polyadenylation specificity factor subunit 4
MAATQTALPDQILHPQSTPAPSFTFDAFIRQPNLVPTVGAPSKVDRPLCQDYIKGACRNPNCTNRHYVPKEERSGIGHLICKHYQRGLCKKGDELCEFAHTFNLRDERECKEFSKYGICPQGDDCTYLHIPPTSMLRAAACPHYTRGFCPLGPYCSLRHIKHKTLCPFYLAGFCPNGRSHPPDSDKVVTCEYGAHARWIKDEDLHPAKPEVRTVKDPETLRREQEEREEEFWAEEERKRERAAAQGGRGGWGGNMRGRGRGGGRGGGGRTGFPGR